MATVASYPKVDLEYAATLRPSKLNGKQLMFMVNVVAGVGFILFGYDQGILSGVLDLESFESTFPITAGGFQGSRSATLQSWLISSYLVGCFFGALANLYVGDKLGRKWTIIIGGFGVIAGTALQCGSINYGMMVFSRIFNGVFNGMITSTVPTYQSECVSAKMRGPMLSISGALIGLGLAVAYFVNVGFWFVGGEKQIAWRIPLALQCVFTLPMIMLFWIYKLPESPRWLAAKGRHEESLAVLAALEGTSVRDTEVTRNWHAICDSIAESAGDFAIKELLSHGKSQHFRRNMLGVLSQMFQQMAGINLIVYYASSVYTLMGMSPLLSRILSGVGGLVFFGGAIVAVFIVERVGRRPLLLLSTITIGITMVVLAGLYNLTQENNYAAQITSIIMVMLYLAFFGVGWLPIPWLYPAEVNPISTADHSVVVVMITGPMFANIGAYTYAFFAIFNLAIILPVVWWFFPETKGFSLEELDLMFALAYEENARVVTISTKERHRIPMAGTPEAEAILGRATPGGPTDVQHLRAMHDVEKGSQGRSSAGNSATRFGAAVGAGGEADSDVNTYSGRSSAEGDRTVDTHNETGKGAAEHDEDATGRRM